MNEKRGPHYNLAKVQAVVLVRGVGCFTKSALDGIRKMGLTTEEALASIAALRRTDCHKSMTTNNDHKVWQDVYHASTSQGLAYIKVTEPSSDQMCISFKSL